MLNKIHTFQYEANQFLYDLDNWYQQYNNNTVDYYMFRSMSILMVNLEIFVRKL